MRINYRVFTFVVIFWLANTKPKALNIDVSTKRKVSGLKAGCECVLKQNLVRILQSLIAETRIGYTVRGPIESPVIIIIMVIIIIINWAQRQHTPPIIATQHNTIRFWYKIMTLQWNRFIVSSAICACNVRTLSSNWQSTALRDPLHISRCPQQWRPPTTAPCLPRGWCHARDWTLVRHANDVTNAVKLYGRRPATGIHNRSLHLVTKSLLSNVHA